MFDFYKHKVQPVLLPRTTSPATSHTSATPDALLTPLRRLPKTDFHCHLNGSITPALLAHMERLLLQEHRLRNVTAHTSTRIATNNTSTTITTTAGGGVSLNDDCNAGEVGSPTAQEMEEGHMLFFNSQEKRMRNVLASPTADDAAAGLPGASTSHSTPKDRMNYCFTVFDAIYKIMTNLAFTRLAVQDMLLCSAAENIAMMEIRTSLRDGLVQTFRQDTCDASLTAAETSNEAAALKSNNNNNNNNNNNSANVVSKEEYVRTVIETVEHLLSGGLVDFESGELISLEASAVVAANPKAGLSEIEGERAEVNGRHADAAAHWWRVFDRVYGSLFKDEAEAEVALSSDMTHAVSTEMASTYRSRLFFVRVVYANWVNHMHVRLLLSINRGAAVSAAWEAAQLTTATQQRQIEDFHRWCSELVERRMNGHQEGNDAAREGKKEEGEESHAVLVRLRRTCWVTGIDLSGNCYKGEYAALRPALEAARNGASPSAEQKTADTSEKKRVCTTAGVTLHGGEKLDEAELRAMVASAPERWGHLVFTDDDNLRFILAAHQGIELCLTSNLLTSGHADVGEHHLGHLLELWDSMPESRGRWDAQRHAANSVEAVWNCTLARRNEARAVSVRQHYKVLNTDEKVPAATSLLPQDHGSVRTQQTEHRSECASAYILPNISFHTDDRGVFGTTLSQELLLAAQHPGVRRLCAQLTQTPHMTVEAATQFFFFLERLSVSQLFNLPLPVQLLAVLVVKEMHAMEHCVSRDLQDACDAAYKQAQVLLSHYKSTSEGEAWQDWNTFVRMCEEVRSSSACADLPCALSAWECAWLYEQFDTYCL